MLGLKLIHISKRGAWAARASQIWHGSAQCSRSTRFSRSINVYVIVLWRLGLRSVSTDRWSWSSIFRTYQDDQVDVLSAHCIYIYIYVYIYTQKCVKFIQDRSPWDTCILVLIFYNALFLIKNIFKSKFTSLRYLQGASILVAWLTAWSNMTPAYDFSCIPGYWFIK